MRALNFISLAVSVFITNYIFCLIIRLLPIKNKKIVQLVIITLADLGSILGYLINLFTIGFELIYFLYTLGNIIGIGVAYIATLMLILDNVILFKSKRTREFERGIQNKEGSSVPRYVLGTICLATSIVLFVYGIINLTHFNQKLLFTTIGVFVAALILIGLALFFFISGRPAHQKLKAEHLLFIIFLPNTNWIYECQLTKEFKIEQALGTITETYFLDEFGLLITPSSKYIVKGMKLDKLTPDIESQIHMTKASNTLYEAIIPNFNKYQRKKIIIDEQNNITKITNIK